MSSIDLVLVAGGSGNRFGGNKLLEPIDKRPVIFHTVRHWMEIGERLGLRSFITVAHPDFIVEYEKEVRKAFRSFPDGLPHPRFVLGGASRFESVLCGLQALEMSGPNESGIVMIHDAARPFVTLSLVEDLLNVLKHVDAAAPAIHPVETVRVKSESTELPSTHPRENVFLMQTPQAFHRKYIELFGEYGKNETEITDDLCIFERAGKSFAVSRGSTDNLKVTHRADMIRCKAILENFRAIEEFNQP